MHAGPPDFRVYRGHVLVEGKVHRILDEQIACRPWPASGGSFIGAMAVHGAIGVQTKPKKRQQWTPFV